MFWIFLGFFIIPNGLAFVDFMQKYTGPKLLLAAAGFAMVASTVVVFTTSRQKLEK